MSGINVIEVPRQNGCVTEVAVQRGRGEGLFASLLSNYKHQLRSSPMVSDILIITEHMKA